MKNNLKYFKENTPMVKILVGGFYHTLNLSGKYSPYMLEEVRKNFREVLAYHGLASNDQNLLGLRIGEKPKTYLEEESFLVLLAMLDSMSDYKALSRLFTLIRYFVGWVEISALKFELDTYGKIEIFDHYSPTKKMLLEAVNKRTKTRNFEYLKTFLLEDKEIVDMCRAGAKSTMSYNLGYSEEERSAIRDNLAEFAYSYGFRNSEYDADFLRLRGFPPSDKPRLTRDSVLFILKSLEGTPKTNQVKNTLKYLKRILEDLQNYNIVIEYLNELKEGKTLSEYEGQTFSPLVENYNSLILKGRPIAVNKGE